MTFSFIDVKVPGGTSQNNEPQMLNEDKPDSVSYTHLTLPTTPNE